MGMGPDGQRSDRSRPRDKAGLDDPMLRDRLARLYAESEILRVHGLRMVAAKIAGKDAPEASVRKALADPHGQRVFWLAKDLAGAAGMLHEQGPLGTSPEWWDTGFLFARP